MQLDIVSPDKDVFSGEVDEVICPGIQGSFGILNNHAPMIAALKAGKIKYKKFNNEVLIDINGGVVEVLNNKVIVLAE